MRIWIVKYGEIIPFGPGREGAHFFRSGELVRRLAARGHEVTWWTGRFEHQTKRHLPDKGNTIEIPGESGSRVVLLDSPGYKSNLSIRRFCDHHVIARNFRNEIRKHPRPDVIVASMPTPELARASADYAQANNVPLIVDVRDMWPDAIIERARKRLRWFPRWLAYPYNRDVIRSLQQATSVTAITRDYLNWAHEKSGRSSRQQAHDRVFHLASRRTPVDSARERELEAIWRARGVEPNTKRIFAWAGSLTDQKATNALLDAQQLLPPEIKDKIQVVICGKGDLEQKVKTVSAAQPHVIYAGYVRRDEVQFLYDHSDFGLLFYDNTRDFQSSFPNKFGEYLMSGLPILTTVKGAMQRDYGDRGFIETVDAEPQAIARAISISANTPERKSVSEQAREVFRSGFDSERVYEAFCDLVVQTASETHTTQVQDGAMTTRQRNEERRTTHRQTEGNRLEMLASIFTLKPMKIQQIAK